MRVEIKYRFDGDTDTNVEIIEVNSDTMYDFTSPMQQALDYLSKKYIWKSEEIVEFSINLRMRDASEGENQVSC